MPAVEAPAKALVTGANGYLAAWIVRILLEQGYRVRGTVRSTEKGDELKRAFAEFEGKFEYVIVKDVLQDGAFDEAVKGVNLIVHSLSPVIISNVPDEVIPPAVKGTVGVLQSAKKHQDTVKRVVITGSIAAVVQYPPVPAIWDESSVNESSIKAIEEGIVNPGIIYCASKTMAEKEAWAFVKNEHISSFDVVFLHGNSFIGPPLLPAKSTKELSSSLQHLYMGAVFSRDAETSFAASGGWIDVRDIALGHVLASQKPEAGGERIIMSAGEFVWQDLHDLAHAIDPILPAGDPSSEKVYFTRYNNEKMKRILGLKPRPLEETMRDSLAFYKTVPDKTFNSAM
ncbi:NAD(P)-binding protein [Peniophora sp. CONT]|nr:NAD(P)-binding protein [Peniophora sp. CONT]